MLIDTKKFLIAFLFFMTVLIALGYYHYQHEQTLINRNINATLQRSVESASVLIGDKYQAQVLKDGLSEIDDAEMIKKLTALAHSQNVAYIYSLILDEEGTLRFTSSSARKQELVTGGNLTRFFDAYSPNANMLKALQTGQSVLDTDEQQDRWGTFRSLYIPYTTPQGQRYLIGADMEVGSIRKLSNAAALKAIGMSLILFLGALPLLLLYRNTLRTTAERLRKEVAAATDKLREVNELLEDKVEEKTKQLISQSFEDTLTGLPNRHRLQYDMDREGFHALVIVNIRNFREINDFFGVGIGDDLLVQMGRWIQRLEHNSYRLSGDEFALLIREPFSADELEFFAFSLIQRLGSHRFSVGVENVSLSVTMGIDPGPELSLAHADIALHQAKEQNKPFAFYSSANLVEKEYQSNITMTKMIHEALLTQRIICYYQPIVSTESGRIVKYESLVRMLDENGAVIAPADFIRIAQKTLLYPQITRRVVSQACATFSKRNEEFSVNLSIRDILDPETVEFIVETVLQTHTERRIVFEILESEGIENFEAVLRFVNRMKALGAKIAIDDFGTGFSSIENILKLNVDYIKIDGSLIRHIRSDPKHATIIKSVALCASKLGAKTVAEFVENEEVYKRVKSTGIDFVQGYYTGKPAPLES